MSQNKLSFYLLVTSQAISLIGGSILRFAISLHVLDLTGSAEIFATMVAISFLPMIVFTPLGGAIADRFSKKILLVISDTAKAAMIGILAFLLFSGVESVFVFGVTITLLSLIATCYGPTVTASLPAILRKEELAKANGITSGIQAMSGMLAPVAGGFLFSTIGINSLVAACAALMLFSAFINIFIKIPHVARKAEGGTVKAILADMKEGFRYVSKENPVLLRAALMFAVVVLFISGMSAIALPYMMRVTFVMGEQAIGFANAAIGSSVLLSSLLAGRLKKFMTMKYLAHIVAIVGIFVIPIAISAMFSPSTNTNGILPILLLVGGFMLISFMLTLTNILVATYAQTHVPSHMIGKVIAIVITIANFSAPIGQFIMGFLIGGLGDAQFALYIAIAVLTFLLGIASRKRLAV